MPPFAYPLPPGAKMSTHCPYALYQDSARPEPTAPTEIVPGVPDGAVVHGSVAGSFPAAATTTIPSANNHEDGCVRQADVEEDTLYAPVISRSKVHGRPLKPMLMLTTAFCAFVWSVRTQSMPAFAIAVVPDPHEFRMRTGTMVTALATPVTEPPMIPATWVPCPSLSTFPLSLASAVLSNVSTSYGWTLAL